MEQPVLISVEGTQRFPGEEKQTIQIVTDGTMEHRDDTVYLRYDESEMTGMEGTTTTFAVGRDQVVLTRTGAIQTKLIFEKGKQNVGLYDMGFGTTTIGVRARRMQSSLGPEGGRLELSYGLQIGGAINSLNSFTIDVRKPVRFPAFAEERPAESGEPSCGRQNIDK